MRPLLRIYGGALAYLVAVAAGVLPTRIWPRIDPRLPVTRAAFVSGVVTLSTGFFAGFAGFLRFAAQNAAANNAWMLLQLTGPANDAARTSAALVPYGASAVSLFAFLFLTPVGLVSTYLVASGALRAASAWVGDPRGDFLLSTAHLALTKVVATNRASRARAVREKLEGRDAPDVLRTGAWAGLNVDYIVLAARRKPEWQAGAIILTSTDWYRLGVPFDIETRAGLRAAYPLTKMQTVEVVRRGIEYDLPRLATRS